MQPSCAHKQIFKIQPHSPKHIVFVYLSSNKHIEYISLLIKHWQSHFFKILSHVLFTVHSYLLASFFLPCLCWNCFFVHYPQQLSISITGQCIELSVCMCVLMQTKQAPLVKTLPLVVKNSHRVSFFFVL